MNKLWLGRLLINLLAYLPKRYPVEPVEQNVENPFFVLNSGRCGSTLFNRLLNQHPDLFLPSEQYFLHNIILKFQLYNYILWRDLGKILAGELVGGLNTHTWKFDCDEVFEKIVHAQGDERALKRIIDLIIRSYASQQGQKFQRWGDTTPLNARYMKDIHRVYPDASYLLLIRDGRDVVSSYKRGGGVKPFMQYANHINGARNWAFVVDTYKWLSKKTPNLMVLRYEDLVADPIAKMNTVFDFLDMDPFNIDIGPQELPNIPMYDTPFHSKLKTPISTSHIGSWQNELSVSELKDIDEILKPGLAQFGYI